MNTPNSLKLYSVFENCYVGKLNFDRPKDQLAKACRIATIVILDNSGSMGQNVRRLAELVIPSAFENAGYSAEDPITFINFESASTLHQTTVGGIAKLGLDSAGGTMMANAIENLAKFVESLDKNIPIRLLTISDGELNDQAETVAACSQLAPVFAERSVNSQAVRYFTSSSEPDTRGLASVLQFSTIDVKDSTRSGLIDVSSATTSDAELASMIAELFCSDGIDFEAFLTTSNETSGIQLVPWSSTQFPKVRLAFGDNVFWFKSLPSDLSVNGEPIEIEQCGALTYENFKIIDAKLQSLAFRVKSLQVVNSAAAKTEVELAKEFFTKLFSALQATLPESDAGEYRKRLALYKNKVRRHFESQASQFREIFNTKSRVKVLGSAQQAVYLQQCSPIKQARSYKSQGAYLSQQVSSQQQSYGGQMYMPQMQQQQMYMPPQQQMPPPPKAPTGSFFKKLFAKPGQQAPAVQQQMPYMQQQMPMAYGYGQQQYGQMEIDDPTPPPQLLPWEQEEDPIELEEMEITLALHDEVKAMRENIAELDGVDDSNHVPSFFSYATTLAGIKAVCELNQDEELFETLGAMEILELINIVGIACNGPIGEFKDPSHWRVDKIFPGCYMSMSDLLVAAKQSGDRVHLTVPQTEEKITSVIPYFEDDRIQAFLQKYAPNLLDYCCSVGMRNKVVAVKQTYWQTLAGGIWKLCQEINETKLEVSINSFCRLVKSYSLATGDDYADKVLQAIESANKDSDRKLSFNLGYCGIQRLIGPLIQLAKKGKLLSNELLPRILRALYAQETYLVIKLARAADKSGKFDARPMFKSNDKLDESKYAEFEKLIVHLDCIALLPHMIELSLGSDSLAKMKALSPIDEAYICQAFAIDYPLKYFKSSNIAQAFTYDCKSKRWDAAQRRMSTIDLGDKKAAEQSVSSYLSSKA